MRIIYKPNPLETVVELDENERKELWYKVKIEELIDRISMAEMSLGDDEFFDLERARSELSFNEITGIDQYVDELVDAFVNHLKGSHIGNCTCYAATCMKCHAEGLLGICTIPNMSKSIGYRILKVFEDYEALDEAIDHLAKVDQNAYQWLVIYRNTYFPRHLTPEEQQATQRALRRSINIVEKGSDEH